jgi:hypothetical protein
MRIRGPCARYYLAFDRYDELRKVNGNKRTIPAPDRQDITP